MLQYFFKKSLTVVFLLLLIQQNVSALCVNSEEYSFSDSQYQLDLEIESYYSLIEESLHHRVISLKLFAQLSNELNDNNHLSASGLTLFKESIRTHLDLRQRLYAVVESRKCWLDNRYRKMDPQLRLQGIMLSLSAALTLYDNYLLVVAAFQENDHFRRIIDQPDMGFGLSSNELLDASLAFHSIINREKVKYAINFYQSQHGTLFSEEKNSEQESSEQESSEQKDLEEWEQNFSYLNALIKQSPSYKVLQENSSLSFLQNKIKFYSIATTDSLIKLEKEGVNLLSLIFGNTVGIVESRKGKLYQRSIIHDKLINTLQAGDILLEKTPFRLTDQFIPGYWGHAAIWIGNEQELRQLGLWDHQLIKPWQEEIKKGRSIIEALRSGVELDPLDHFMNIDDMVVLRDRAMTKEQSRQVIINAFRQLGKEYDFNFDISSSDRIVCSELVYISYLHIDWPTKKTLGRYTISPDHIAQKAKSEKLSVVSLYLDGKQIDKDPENYLLHTLLK